MNSIYSFPLKKNFGFSLLFKLKQMTKFNTKIDFKNFKFSTVESKSNNDIEGEKEKNTKKKRINNSEMQRMLNSLYRFQETKSNFKEESNNKDENKNESTEKVEKEKVGLLKKSINGFVNLWNRTFPKEINYETEMKIKQKEAELIKSQIVYAKDEEIENFKSKVLEWKQEAVILVESLIKQEKNNILKKYTKMINEKIGKSETYNKLKETNTFKEYVQFKEDLQVIKTNIQDNISVSYNPAVIAMKDLAVR